MSRMEAFITRCKGQRGAEQVRAVEAILVSESRNLTAKQVAQHFLRARATTAQEILDTLTDLGQI